MTSERFYTSSKFYDVTAAIAVGETKSAALNLNGLELVGVFVPAGFDGSALALEAATSATGTYLPVQDGSGSDFSLPAAPGRFVPIPNLAVTAGLQYIKLVAATAQAGTDTVLTLALRPV